MRGVVEPPTPYLTENERALYEHLSKELPSAPPAAVDVEVENGDRIALGGETARVIHVPGHTAGSIALLLPDRGLLFTGDAAASSGHAPMIGIFNVDPAEARKSFAILDGMGFETACYGHGPPLIGNASAQFRRAAGIP